MNDNVIKFQKPKPPKRPRQVPSWLKRLLVLLGIILVLTAGYAYFYVTGGSAQAATFQKCGILKRNCVVDGDTLYVGGDKVRVADIDTPEVSKPQCPHEKELGDKATARFIELVNVGPFECGRGKAEMRISMAESCACSSVTVEAWEISSSGKGWLVRGQDAASRGVNGYAEQQRKPPDPFRI